MNCLYCLKKIKKLYPYKYNTLYLCKKCDVEFYSDKQNQNIDIVSFKNYDGYSISLILNQNKSVIFWDAEHITKWGSNPIIVNALFKITPNTLESFVKNKLKLYLLFS